MVALYRFLFVFLKRYIYLIVDIKERVIKYGNIFIDQEVPIGMVISVEQKYWTQLIKIRIGEQRYSFIAPGIKLDEIKNALEVTD